MTIEITKDSFNSIDIKSIFELDAAVHLVADAVEDVGDAIEAEARLQAPLGDTGELKLHPVDRSDVGFGVIEEATGRARHPAGAPGGIGGRFIGGGETGKTLVRQTITLPAEPKYAIFVHDGTGIYGKFHHPIVPTHHPYMAWKEDGKWHKHKEVKGQPANPYLERAFVIIERTYLPARVERLRAELKAL